MSQRQGSPGSSGGSRLLSSTVTRTILGVVVLVAVGGGAAFVLTSVDLGADDGNAGTDTEDLSAIPGDVDMLVYVEPDFVNDTSTRTLYGGMANLTESQTGMSTTPSYDELLDSFENESNLNRSAVDHAYFFARYPPENETMDSEDEYAGFVFQSEWDTDAIVGVFDNNSEQRNSTKGRYGGVTVYKSEPALPSGTESWLAVLGDGEYAFGPKTVVKDVVDTDSGEKAVDAGPVRKAYRNAAPGHVKFAMGIPEERIPENESVGATMVNTEAFTDIRVLGGTYSTPQDNISLDLWLRTENESAAEDVYQVVDGVVSIYKGLFVDDGIVGEFEKISVTQDGTMVEWSYETDPKDLVNATKTTINRTESASEEDAEFGSESESGTTFATAP